MIKECAICGKQFETGHNQKYCSDLCRSKARRTYKYHYNKEQRHEYYLKNKERINARAKQYRLDNPEKYNAFKERQKQRRQIQRCSLKHNNCFACPTKNGECLYD